MAADIKPFQNMLTPSPIKDESALSRFLRIAKENNITPDSNTLGILAAADAFGGPKTPGYREEGGLRDQLYDLNSLQQQQADYRQKLGKESTAEAFRYKMFQQGLDKLGNAFNPYGSKEGALAYAAHLNNLPNVVNDTMRSIPMMNVQGVAYNAPQRQYFS
jgi:hypothetical protein